MNKFLAALFLLTVSAGPASAAHDEWEGNVCITTNPLPAACVADAVTLGSCAGLRFRPPTAANGPGTSFSLFAQGFAENYSAPGSVVGTLPKPVTGSAIAGAVFTFSSKMALAQTPALVTSATKFITMTGQITTFDGAVGCDIAIRGAASLRPPH
jgi:hypothetical protein